MRVALALLCAAGCALPDEIGVGLGATQYDYLGTGEPPYILEDQTGEGLSANGWASWALKPTRMVMIAEERAVEWWKPPVEPTPIPDSQPAPDDGGLNPQGLIEATGKADLFTKLIVLVAVLAAGFCAYVWIRRSKPKESK